MKDDDKFDKLFNYDKSFNYMVAMDKRIDSRFDVIEAEIRELRNMPDAIGKRLDNNDDEQAARDAQWNRLVEWARKVSEKTGVPLPDL